MARPARSAARPKVLVVDDDHDTAEVMQALLIDEGYAPSMLYDARGKVVKEAVVRLEPDCVLLDSSADDPTGYGESWRTAAWLSSREPSVAVIMMTGHSHAADEAVAAVTNRARAADFAAIVRKPFDIDEFVATLHSAVQKGAARRKSDSETAVRIAEMREQLLALGARDLTTSSRRVWALFKGAGEALLQIYWWETQSLYLLGRYSEDGARLEPLGQFTELAAAIAVALPEST